MDILSRMAVDLLYDARGGISGQAHGIWVSLKWMSPLLLCSMYPFLLLTMMLRDPGSIPPCAYSLGLAIDGLYGWMRDERWLRLLRNRAFGKGKNILGLLMSGKGVRIGTFSSTEGQDMMAGKSVT